MSFFFQHWGVFEPKACTQKNSLIIVFTNTFSRRYRFESFAIIMQTKTVRFFSLKLKKVTKFVEVFHDSLLKSDLHTNMRILDMWNFPATNQYKVYKKFRIAARYYSLVIIIYYYSYKQYSRLLITNGYWLAVGRIAIVCIGIKRWICCIEASCCCNRCNRSLLLFVGSSISLKNGFLDLRILD